VTRVRVRAGDELLAVPGRVLGRFGGRVGDGAFGGVAQGEKQAASEEAVACPTYAARAATDLAGTGAAQLRLEVGVPDTAQAEPADTGPFPEKFGRGSGRPFD
jgi:hypothetical protein